MTKGTLPLLFILQLSFRGVVVKEATILTGVRHLMGEPDFRSVTLRWESDRLQSAPRYGFRISYCEVQAWGRDRCRVQTINATSTNEVMMAPSSPVRMFFAQVNGLRMATNYSFEVWPEAEGVSEDLISSDLRSNLSKTIILETKESKATLCLPQFSEVEVETGPYFGGRIAVEGADENTSNESIGAPEESRTGKQKKERKGRCWVDGDPESPKTTYTLRIEHQAGDACGGGSVAAINETAISAFVMVQESQSILTHSARRFLVLCSYQPGMLTVRAGIQLPSPGGRGESVLDGHNVEAEAINEIIEPKLLRQSREKTYEGLIVARAHTAERLIAQDMKKSSTSAQLVLMLLLIATGVVGFAILAVWHLVMSGTQWRLLGEHEAREPIAGEGREAISSGTLIKVEVTPAQADGEEEVTPAQADGEEEVTPAQADGEEEVTPFQQQKGFVAAANGEKSGNDLDNGQPK